ncbi:MAG: dephospho-CoA kinase [Deltaproteobacteria bacterium]|nr:dephospho-CoA kinase [Deltaproteobacteria bacterium]
MPAGLTVVGLTGGIASGKSTVARFLREAGVPVLDADSLGHMVLEPDGAAYRPVLQKFGKQILGLDGATIDRQKLGGLVFDSPAHRQALEAITHPEIAALAKQGLELIAERGEPLAVYEAALLVETGIHQDLAGLIVVSCPLEDQVERVCARDGISRPAAAARIASQLPLEDKLAVADFEIANDGDFEQLRSRTLELLELVRQRFDIDGAGR